MLKLIGLDQNSNNCMAKAKYQERTLEILRFIEKEGRVTSQELADELDLSRSFAASQLLKFKRRNWLERKPIEHRRGQPIYEYSLKEKGKDRFKFMENVRNIMDKQDVDWNEAKNILLSN